MVEHDPEILSQEEAARLWQRAAQLQAEAAGRVEPPDVNGVAVASSGYALAHVRSAATEAGIAIEFVDAALADLRVERARPRAEQSNSLARRFLNNPPDTITTRRLIEATPQEVLSAMEAVFPDRPFRLTLTDQQGDPLDQGVLVFDMQGANSLLLQGGFAFETREAGLRQVFVSLRAVEGSTSGCEMTMHSPVTSHNLGLGLGLIVSAISAGVGGFVLGTLGMVLGIGPMGGVAGVLVGAGLGVKGYRALYRYAIRRGQKALEGLIGAVAVRAKGVWQGS
ncbi:MAG: hypothetical protein E2O47_08445 [Gemmatimonadetes bacterium]|nr:MAG: hypothetical protein E2O47_08445 [Gemmatimonadota bacterium]